MTDSDFGLSPETIIRERMRQQEIPGDHDPAARKITKLAVDSQFETDNTTASVNRINELIPEILQSLEEHGYPDGELAYVPDEDGTLSERAIWQVGSKLVFGGGLPTCAPKEPDGVIGPGPVTTHLVFLASNGGIYHRLEKSQAGQPKSDYRRITTDSMEDIDRWFGKQENDIRGRTGWLRLFFGAGPVLSTEFTPMQHDDSLLIDQGSLISMLENGLRRIQRKYVVIDKRV